MVEQRALGRSGIKVAEIGYGAMGLTHAYGEPMLGEREKDAIDVIHRAIDLGVTLFDTAEIYGPLTNEALLGKALKGKRDQVTIATKTGFVVGDKVGGDLERDGRPATIKRALEGSLQRLGVEMIDIYQLHRVDPKIPVEESVGAMAELVREGKVRAIGLSEVDVPTMERAMAVHPIATLQSELSLWTRDVLAEILPWCKTNGVGFLAFSPLGRGFLTGRLTQGELSAKDFRSTLPRFQGENFAENMRIVQQVETVAKRLGATNGQVAIAWSLAQGDNVVPIPGTKRIKYLEENIGAAAIELSESDLAELNAIEPPVGARYGN